MYDDSSSHRDPVEGRKSLTVLMRAPDGDPGPLFDWCMDDICIGHRGGYIYIINLFLIFKNE